MPRARTSLLQTSCPSYYPLVACSMSCVLPVTVAARRRERARKRHTTRQRKWVGGVVARRSVAFVVAVVLVLEAAGIVLLNWILSVFVDRQKMSLAGLDAGAMAKGAVVAGLVFGLYLLCCAFLAARCAVRDRAPGTFARIVLISCAVVHGVVGAFTYGLVSWVALVGALVVLGLLIYTLVAYADPRESPAPPADDTDGGPHGGTGEAPATA